MQNSFYKLFTMDHAGQRDYTRNFKGTVKEKFKGV